MDMEMVSSFLEMKSTEKYHRDDCNDVLPRSQKVATIKYKWVCSSNDGSYNIDSEYDLGKVFLTQEKAYEDMRKSAVLKILWNTDWKDVNEDCIVKERNGLKVSSGSLDANGENVGENWGIPYRLQFHPNMIQHWSYSGLYTYKIVVID